MGKVELFNVVERMYDDVDYRENLNKEPVSYEEAVAIDRNASAGYSGDDEDTYFIEIKKA